MAISGIQTIGIGLQNESTGSDSLYAAFTKVNTNFNTLSSCASPFNTFTASNGVSINANANSGIVTVTNTGVRSLIAGTNIVLSSANGDVTISAGGGNSNNSGTVTSVGLTPASSTRLTVTNSPIVSSGSFTIDLANTGVSSGTYTYPTVTVDTYGRITNITNANAVGTVTSVVVSGGAGIQVTGSPITTNGNISIINTGVTRISAGTGVAVTGSNGNVTISVASLGGTVTSVGMSSTSLIITGSPVTSTGTIEVNLPTNIAIAGQLLLNGSQNLTSNTAVNLAVTASRFTTIGASTATLAAGTTGLIKTFMMVGDAGDMVITVTNAGWKTSGSGTITFGDIGDGCTLQYINNKWYCIGQNGVTFA